MGAGRRPVHIGDHHCRVTTWTALERQGLSHQVKRYMSFDSPYAGAVGQRVTSRAILREYADVRYSSP